MPRCYFRLDAAFKLIDHRQLGPTTTLHEINMAASNMETIKTYKISGCDINFPHAAYGTQLSFMGKVIRALDTGQNALLEAPTGTNGGFKTHDISIIYDL